MFAARSQSWTAHRLSFLICWIILILVAAAPTPATAQPPATEPPPEFIRAWSEAGPLRHITPIDVAVDGWGMIYVADDQNECVIKLDRNGSYLTHWGELGRPMGIAIDPTNQFVYVTDQHAVLMYTTAGDSLHAWYPSGPYDVAVDHDGIVYVSTPPLVRQYTSHGTFLGVYDPGDSYFDPFGLHVDDLNRLWIAAGARDDLVIYPYINGAPEYWISDGYPLDHPIDCRVDPLGNVYVLNDGIDNIGKYDRYGVFLSEISLPLVTAQGFTLFGNGMLYVADTLNERLAVYGYPPRDLTVTDVPDDQGGWVRLRWQASVLDSPSVTGMMTGYTIYRQNNAAVPRPVHPSGPDAAIREAAKELEGWDVLATIPARGDSTYQFITPTLCDSTSQGDCYLNFMVTAYTDRGEFHDGPIVAGCSVDNLPPAAPVGLVITEIPGPPRLHLEWAPSSAPDLSHYFIYTDTLPDFPVIRPDRPWLVATAPFYYQTKVNPGETWYYRVAAVDHTGNISDPSEDQGITVVSASGDVPEPAFGLAQNVPNPFNPTTNISFRVPEPGTVSLRIFDASGRLVRTLLHETYKDVGPQTLRWNGRDDSGREVAAGIYFCRLETGALVQTKRMVFVK